MFSSIAVSFASWRTERQHRTVAAFGLAAALAAIAPLSVRAQDSRGDVSRKGSLLVFPAVEIKWDSHNRVIQDTFLAISNDFARGVELQFYFLNGDEPLPERFVGFPEKRIAEFEPGWNKMDCRVYLTPNQPMYWSAARGTPGGCQAFSVLDPPAGFQKYGRPDPETDGTTLVLRGTVLVWAVGYFDHPEGWQEIRWNHLYGSAMTVNYAEGAAWEYNAHSFQALTLAPNGSPTDDRPGQLSLDGVEYEAPPAKLLIDFYAAGSLAMSLDDPNAPGSVSLDTDLTLHPASFDFRQDNDGPVITKVEFEVFNQNESKLSGQRRCITCWDQTLMSRYITAVGIPNYFLRDLLGTDKGQARIDGVASVECDFLEHYGIDRKKSENAALLGVASKVLSFDADANRDATGMNLINVGEEPARVLYDVFLGQNGDQPIQETGESRQGPVSKSSAKIDTGRTTVPGRVEDLRGE